MHRMLSGISYLLLLIGVVWFLQGINVLPGSFMTGQIKWALIGGIVFAAGAALGQWARRLRKRSERQSNDDQG